MKRFLVYIFLAFMAVPSLHATVFLVGRNIAISPGKSEDSLMLKDMGHSYLVIVPNSPEKVKQVSPLYAQWEKEIGCGKRGVIIGAYPEDNVSLLKASLQAQINATREDVPTQSFLCGTQDKKTVWNFTGGPVKSNLAEEEFIRRLLLNVQRYITVTKEHPIDYHALRSVAERTKNPEATWAQNCNAFAFSLLVYSGVNEIPTISTRHRAMPGHHRLLPDTLFYTFPPTSGILEKLRTEKSTFPHVLNRIIRSIRCQLQR